MQTPRLLSVIAVITLCASAFSTRADDTPAQAAARAALMQDMNDTGNTETAPPPATPATPPPAESVPPPPPMNMETNMPMATQAPVATMPATTTGSSTNLVVPPVEQMTVPTNQVSQFPVNPAPGTYTNAAVAQANAMGALTGQTTGNGEPSAPQMSGAGTAQPITAPSLPITDSQQQQLQALLQQYMANQITPAQYQAERAKILAGQ